MWSGVRTTANACLCRISENIFLSQQVDRSHWLWIDNCVIREILISILKLLRTAKLGGTECILCQSDRCRCVGDSNKQGQRMRIEGRWGRCFSTVEGGDGYKMMQKQDRLWCDQKQTMRTKEVRAILRSSHARCRLILQMFTYKEQMLYWSAREIKYQQ